MALFGFDSDPFEYLDDAVHDLEDELEKGRDSTISVRSGYDENPRNYDLWKVEDQAFMSEDERPWKVEKLSEYMNRFLDEESYVDWTTGDEFDEYSIEREEVIGTSAEGRLILREYSPGDQGHNIFRCDNNNTPTGLM